MRLHPLRLLRRRRDRFQRLSIRRKLIRQALADIWQAHPLGNRSLVRARSEASSITRPSWNVADEVADDVDLFTVLPTSRPRASSRQVRHSDTCVAASIRASSRDEAA
jgi:hypothetical protein